MPTAVDTLFREMLEGLGKEMSKVREEDPGLISELDQGAREIRSDLEDYGVDLRSEEVAKAFLSLIRVMNLRCQAHYETCSEHAPNEVGMIQVSGLEMSSACLDLTAAIFEMYR